MAMIVEVLDSREGGVRARVRLDSLPVTIGRAYDNDVILDDAYVDARHARIVVNAEGGIEIEDLGTVNGLVQVGARDRLPRLAAAPGTEVRVGRTLLRFRDPAEPVAPALRDRATEAALHERILASGWARAATCLAAVALIALQTWLGSYERDTAQTVVTVILGIGIIGGLWAGAWAVGSRVATGRFNFIAHYTIFSAIAVLAMILGAGDAWGTFLFPDSRILSALSMMIWTALFAASIAAHLTQSSTMNRFRRWRAAVVATGLCIAFALVIEFTSRELFTDVPEYSGVLKYAPAGILPQLEHAAFTSVVEEAARRSDEMAQD